MKPKTESLESNPYASPKTEPGVEQELQTEGDTEYCGRLYNTLSIAIATIFGSVLAAGLLIYSNYSRFKQEKYSLIAAGLTGVLTLSFMLSMLIIDFPLVMLYLAINFVIAASVLPLNQTLQGKQLEQHEEGGREFHSYIRACLMGVSCAIAMMTMLFIASSMYVMVL